MLVAAGLVAVIIAGGMWFWSSSSRGPWDAQTREILAERGFEDLRLEGGEHCDAWFSSLAKTRGAAAQAGSGQAGREAEGPKDRQEPDGEASPESFGTAWRGVVDALFERGWTTWQFAAPRPRGVMTPEALCAQLRGVKGPIQDGIADKGASKGASAQGEARRLGEEKDGAEEDGRDGDDMRMVGEQAPFPLYTLERALLAQAFAVYRGHAADLIEVFAYPDDDQPADRTARWGAYALRVHRDGEDAFWDLRDGGRLASKRDQERRAAWLAAEDDAWTLLAPTQVLARFLGTRAVEEAHGTDGDGKIGGKALELADDAVRLDETSPTQRHLTAAVAMALGYAQRVQDSLEAAASLRRDGVRLLRLAQLAMAKNDVTRAKSLLAEATGAQPAFVLAHASMIEIFLAEDDVDRADVELRRLSASAQRHPQVMLLRAKVAQRQGRSEEARTLLDTLTKQAVPDWQMWMQLAVLYHQAGASPAAQEAKGHAERWAPTAQQTLLSQLFASAGLDASGGDALELGGGMGDINLEEPMPGAETLPDSDFQLRDPSESFGTMDAKKGLGPGQGSSMFD